MKLSKDELKQKISDRITDNEDLVIELLEDIEDSMVTSTEQIIDETKEKELDEIRWKYDDLKRKYKERFLKSEKTTEDIDETEDIEKKIDIKEI